MDGMISADDFDPETHKQCPQCAQMWPLDRFNDRDPECFRCRARSVGVSFGPAGKAFWHGTTVKEYRDKTISQAVANGLDPVPVHSASVPMAASTLKKLESSPVKAPNAG
jgi:hypothetical protein